MVSFTESGGNPVVHANLDADAYVLDLSPDGKYLLVARPGPEGEELYRTLLDGKSGAQAITRGEFDAIHQARFSSDGRKVVVVGSFASSTYFGEAPIGGELDLYEGEVYAADYLADGRLAVIGEVEDGEPDAGRTYVGTFANGEVTEIADLPAPVQSMDAGGDMVVASCIVWGDESGLADLYRLRISETTASRVTDGSVTLLDPHFGAGGTLFAIQDGVGLVQVDGTGSVTTRVESADLIGLIAIR